jgi:hypothetical protein
VPDRLDGSRRAFLARVESILRTLPVDLDVAHGDLETPAAIIPGWARSAIVAGWGPPAGVPGLLVRSPLALPSVNGLAQVAAATVVDEGDAYEAFGGRVVRDRSLRFDPFPGRGRAVYTLYVLEDPWEASGHGRWSPPARVLQSEDPAEIATTVAAWAGHGAAAPGPLVPPRAVRAAQLRRQLEARRAALATVEVVADLGPPALVEAAGEPALEHVGRRLLAWHFPRDRRGRLQARAVVALRCVRLGARPQARQLWLCAEGSEPRAPERIHLRLRWEHGANQDHRWDGARSLWDTRCQGLGLDARWGVADRARADRSASLMERGRFSEGLGLYGVELSPEADQVARGRAPWYGLRHLAATWAGAMGAHLADAAPWLLAAAAGEAGTASRPVRLFGLGGQNIARKPGLFLAGAPGRPRLEIHWSGSSARLPLVAWRRPADYELLRLGLVDEAELLAIGRDGP